jgi:hypothetical protein
LQHSNDVHLNYDSFGVPTPMPLLLLFSTAALTEDGRSGAMETVTATLFGLPMLSK